MASFARCVRAAARVSASASVPVPGLARAARPAPFHAIRAFSVSSQLAIRKYTKDHEWVDLDADQASGVIGISAYAAEALGDVVYVELPEQGKEVGAGDAIGAVESVKSAADINAPIACKVVHVNHGLEEKPGTINQVPEDDSAGGGWIAKVVLSEQGIKDFEGLMSADEYKEFTASEDH